MKNLKLFSLNSLGKEVSEEWQMDNSFSQVSSDPPQVSSKAPLHQGRSPRALLQVSPHWQWWWWHLPEMYFKVTGVPIVTCGPSLVDSLPLVIKKVKRHCAHPIWGAEALHGQWHHMWTHPTATIFWAWWKQGGGHGCYVPPRFSACEAWEWPNLGRGFGQVVLFMSPSSGRPLFFMRTLMSQTHGFLDQKDWCDLAVNYIANFIQNILPRTRH